MKKAPVHKRGRLISITIALITIFLSMLFIWYRLASPSDGLRLVYSVFAWKPEGIAVTPIGDSDNDLQDDDIISAVDGQLMESWVKGLFKPNTWGSRWDIGQTVAYTIIRDGEKQIQSIRLGEFPLSGILSTYWGPLLFALASQIVTTFVLVRRPDDEAAQVLFIWAWSGSHTYAWSLGLQVSDLTNGFGFWLYYLFTPGLWLLYWSSALHFALIFPKKHTLVQRFPKVIPVIYIGPYLSLYAFMAFDWQRYSSLIERIGAWSVFPNLVALLYLSLIVLTIIWSYKKLYDPISRQKIRWLVYGASISGGGGLVLWILPPILLGHQVISENMLGLLTLPFPITIAIAILRHQLFDIDLLINRTLVYGLLTGALALLYFSSVVLLQNFFRALTGESSQVAIVLTTLGIASLFNPLRRRVQGFIDRRFYRSKYDAEQALNSFAKSLRDEVDLASLESRLITVIEETMYPKHVSIWLRAPEKKPES